jgi:hypothetical protein
MAGVPSYIIYLYQEGDMVFKVTFTFGAARVEK